MLLIDAAGVTVLRNAQLSASLSQVIMTVVGRPPHLKSAQTAGERPITVAAHR